MIQTGLLILKYRMLAMLFNIDINIVDMLVLKYRFRYVLNINDIKASKLVQNNFGFALA